MISYYHYGGLVYFQGVIKETEKEALIKKIADASIHDLYRYQPPFTCDLCIQIDQIYQEKLGSNQGILYMAHENLELDELLKFTNTVLDDQRVKKLYFFQGGPVKKSERKKPIILKDRLASMLCVKSDFIKILQNEQFKQETIYEVMKDSYY
ncbi:MAG: hypothetical protein ACXAD7_20265 [Candidatus Kariarchaeaceae archaeon]|jgi:hypothetical protein